MTESTDPNFLAELLSRVDAFCADLESQGLIVKRTGSAIKISLPPKPKRRGLGPSHGTARRYETKGCRCDECRAAKSRKQAAYRERAAKQHAPGPPGCHD